MNPKDPQAAIDGLLNHADWTDAPISSWAARDAILALFQAHQLELLNELLDEMHPYRTIESMRFLIERLQNKTNDGGQYGG